MSDGIVIEGCTDITLINNTIEGCKTGIKAKDSKDIRIQNNFILSEEALRNYGPGFQGVFHTVRDSQDKNAIAALATIQEEPQPDKAVSEWVTVIKKFPDELGSYAASTLPKVLSATAYKVLKAALSIHGIELP